MAFTTAGTNEGLCSNFATKSGSSESWEKAGKQLLVSGFHLFLQILFDAVDVNLSEVHDRPAG